MATANCRQCGRTGRRHGKMTRHFSQVIWLIVGTSLVLFFTSLTLNMVRPRERYFGWEEKLDGGRTEEF